MKSTKLVNLLCGLHVSHLWVLVTVLRPDQKNSGAFQVPSASCLRAHAALLCMPRGVSHDSPTSGLLTTTLNRPLFVTSQQTSLPDFHRTLFSRQLRFILFGGYFFVLFSFLKKRERETWNPQRKDSAPFLVRKDSPPFPLYFSLLFLTIPCLWNK